MKPISVALDNRGNRGVSDFDRTHRLVVRGASKLGAGRDSQQRDQQHSGRLLL